MDHVKTRDRQRRKTWSEEETGNREEDLPCSQAAGERSGKWPRTKCVHISRKLSLGALFGDLHPEHDGDDDEIGGAGGHGKRGKGYGPSRNGDKQGRFLVASE
uniref:Uncharacterized protein n=1 Tax=Rhizophora mucronata TaxID=61149 RepID=A0A2P2J8V1_RHIMU